MRVEINKTEKPLFHILHANLEKSENSGYGAELEAIGTETLEGVYTNMAKQGWEPGQVKVIFGTRVQLDDAVLTAWDSGC